MRIQENTNSIVMYADKNNAMVDAFGDVVKFIPQFPEPTDDTTGDPTRFVSTVVEAGTGTSITSNSVVAGEWLTLTTAANEYDGMNVQVKGSTFEVDTSKPFYFGCKLKVSDATQSDLFVGLASVDTTLLATSSAHAIALVGDGLFFSKLDGGTTVAAKTYLDNSEVATANVETALSTTAVKYEIIYDGVTLKFFADDVQVSCVTADLPDSVMTPSINFRAGAAAAKVMSVYWMRAIQLL